MKIQAASPVYGRSRLRPLVVSVLGGLLGVAALAGCSGGDSAPASAPSSATKACAGQETWPRRMLTAADANLVDPAEFIAEAQLAAWASQNDVLRPTGAPAHEAYIDRLAARLKCAGVTDVRFEEVPLENQWLAKDWSLDVVDGPSAGPVKVASYTPYTGITPAQGITAPVVYLGTDDATPANAAGKIVVFDVPVSPLPIAAFTLFSMGLHDIDLEAAKLYSRPYLSNAAVHERQTQLEEAGAVGAVAILPVAYDGAHGAYFPYDGTLYDVPMLYVDRHVGAQLTALANGSTRARLTLTATVKRAKTRNILAFIPGASDELTVVNSHTDGTNYIEDNGPDAMIGMAQYLSRLPRESLPRSVLFMFSAGHFSGGAAIKSFLDRHASDGLLDRMASITTVEHLGSQEWEPDSDGVLRYTGNAELGAMFMPQTKALADAGCDWFLNADAGPGAVLKPLNPNGNGEANDAVWPGEGQYFYGLAGIPTANYITGPYYLLNWGISTVDKTDFDRMRSQIVAFTQMQLDLSGKSRDALAATGIGVATIGSGKYLRKGICVPTPVPVTIPFP